MAVAVTVLDAEISTATSEKDSTLCEVCKPFRVVSPRPVGVRQLSCQSSVGRTLYTCACQESDPLRHLAPIVQFPTGTTI